MKPVDILSDAELAAEYHAVARMAGRLRHEGHLPAADQLTQRQAAVLTEMTRRAERSYEI